MRAILALGAIVVSTAAVAQLGQNPPVGPDTGFFRPTPNNDPSIHAPVVAPQPAVPVVQPAMPVAQTAVAQPAQAQSAQQPVTVPVYVPVQVATPPAVAPVEPGGGPAAEADLDRAQREAQEAQERAKQQPAPINGAFTGLTSERDR
jgi:hypothetical protein